MAMTKANHLSGARHIDGRGGSVIVNGGVLIEGTTINAPMPLEAWPNDRPQMLLVFIAHGIGKLEIQKTMSAFDFAGSGNASGAHSREGYTQFLDAVRGID